MSYRDTSDVAEATARLVRAVGNRVAQEDPSDLLALRRLDEALEHAWATAIAGLRSRSQFSDAQIGDVLGVTKQAVAKRWPRESPANSA